MISIYLVVGVYLGLYLQLNYIPNKNDNYGKTNFIHEIIEHNILKVKVLPRNIAQMNILQIYKCCECKMYNLDKTIKLWADEN